MAAKKYYVVWKGAVSGIFDTWKECEAQIRGFTGAVYMSFPDRIQAEKAFREGSQLHIGKKFHKPAMSKEELKKVGKPVMESLSVDAACSGNPGVLEYRGVNTKTGKQLFRQGPFPLGTINIGEFLAIVHALAYLKKRNSVIPVYSDSKTAIKWVKDKAIKTKLQRSDKNEELFRLIERAIFWLNQNDYSNPLGKWQTEYWGEIPADFGRK
jgi:ribonuclease HI